MITQESNPLKTSRCALKLGDVMLVGFVNRLFSKIFKSPNEALLEAFGLYFRAIKGTLAYCMSVIFGDKRGKCQSGFFVSFGGLSALTCANSIHVWEGFTSISPFIALFVLFTSTWEQIYSYVFQDIRSFPLLLFSGVYLACALYNTLAVYCGYGDHEAISSRGRSYLYRLLCFLTRKWSKVNINKLFIEGFVQPGLIAVLGLLAWHFWDDTHFAVMMCCIAASESWICFSDFSHATREEILLKR